MRPFKRRYLLASAAPGPLTARPLDPPVAGLPDPLTAQWQEDGSGYRVELRLPRSLKLARAGRGRVRRIHAGGDPMAADTRPLLRLLHDAFQRTGQAAPDEVQARVLAPQGWLLAPQRSIEHSARALTASRAGSLR
jgi:two-component system sensor histidine kinase ChvG